MKKFTVLMLSLLCVISLLAGCLNQAAPEDGASSDTASPEESVETRVLTLKGPTGIGMAKLMDDAAKDQNSKYSFTIASQPTEAVAAVSSGQVDIAAVPTNLAATLYNRTEKEIKMIAINTLGSLYILENGNTVSSFEDLRGKTVYATGQGANPEFVLNYLLEKNGLKVGVDVQIEFKAEHAELAALMAAGECVLGMLPEPNVSSAMAQNKDLRIALNLNDEWTKVADDSSRLTMGCVIVNAKFAEEHPEQVKLFIDQLEASVKYAAENPTEAGVLCETYEIVPKAAIATKAIPNCNLTLIKGSDMKPAIEDYFNVLHSADPTSVGGTVPDESFYFVP